MIPHIRARMPRKGGNSFYRDTNDYTKFCVTLCGAPITDKDVDYATANTKKFRASGWDVCAACLAKQDEMQAAVIAALTDAFPKTRRCIRCNTDYVPFSSRCQCGANASLRDNR